MTIKKTHLTKSGKQVESSNHIRYTIKVNEGGLDLDAKFDRLTLSDTVNDRGTFLPQAFTAVDNSNNVLKGSSLSEEGKTPTLEVLVGLLVTVTYDVITVGNVGDGAEIRNTAVHMGIVNKTVNGGPETVAFEGVIYILAEAGKT
ncbi:hypothetical protein [Paratractidigestivibacter sp.]|uniref:hypothetical protein n=1 Tax=Paratractidigestivibacter sp. TaxID=2847316 RepID=UPI002ABE88D5|nr:hypothetical protein [Paratractidigestivibacter sp.]